ncbi:MAG: hypothetical protein ACPL7D_06050 [Candidatus Sumerlaeaceae bacterium]
MKKAVVSVGLVAVLGMAATLSAQVCWNENPSLVPPKREPHQVCAPRARGGFGFWTRATSLVAADSYIMPKYASRGYTYTATWGLTNDFNSAPRVPQYVSFVHKVPYTHPPVYPPVPGGETAVASLRNLGAPPVTTVSIEY